MINRAVGMPGEPPRRRTASRNRSFARGVCNIKGHTANDLRILSPSYGSPVEILVLAASGIGAAALRPALAAPSRSSGGPVPAGRRWPAGARHLGDRAGVPRSPPGMPSL